MNRYFAHLRLENIAFNAYDVANIEKLFKHFVVQILIFCGAEVVARDIQLYASLAVLQLCKRRLSHDSLAHQAACDGYFALFIVLEIGLDVVARGVYGKLFGGIGVDAHVAKLLQTLATANLLLT